MREKKKKETYVTLSASWATKHQAGAVNGVGSGVRMAWVQVLALQLLSSVTPGEVTKRLSFLIKEGEIRLFH